MKNKIMGTIGILTILLLSTPSMALNATKLEIHGAIFDEKSSIYNRTVWDAQNFTGFWYALPGGKSSENLAIIDSVLTSNNRQIEKDKLIYTASRTDQKYYVFIDKGKKVENALEYDSISKTFTKSKLGGYYSRIGLFGEMYVAINGKANKLAKLLFNDATGAKNKKTLKLGDTWSLGNGYNLTVDAIDAKTYRRQASLLLSLNDSTLDNKIVNEGEVYTYIAKDLKGESDVPIFVTYIDGIFAGEQGMGTFIQLKYTWLISQDVIEIKTDDKYGIFDAKEANENYILFKNRESISLSPNTVTNLYKEFKIKVADNADILRFYPISEKTLPGKYELRGGVFDHTQSKYNSLTWDAQRFPGFWYAPPGGKSSENLAIEQPVSSLTNISRTIEKDKLVYTTLLTDQRYNVFKDLGKKVDNGLEYDNNTKTFTKSKSGGFYGRIGWFGTMYIAINGKANKLTKLLVNDSKEKKTLQKGETWNLSNDYSLKIEDIDAKTYPRQAHLSLKDKNNNKIDDKIINEDSVYTYTIGNLKEESDIPIFTTYIESIFTGDNNTFVQLKYTWLISQDVIEIKTGDKFGVFEVEKADDNHILLRNKDASINLGPNSIQELYGNFKFKVADNVLALRFYPFIEYNISGDNASTSNVNIQTVPKEVPTDIPKEVHTDIPKEVHTDTPSITESIPTNIVLTPQTKESSGLSPPVVLIIILMTVLYNKNKRR